MVWPATGATPATPVAGGVVVGVGVVVLVSVLRVVSGVVVALSFGGRHLGTTAKEGQCSR